MHRATPESGDVRKAQLYLPSAPHLSSLTITENQTPQAPAPFDGSTLTFNPFTGRTPVAMMRPIKPATELYLEFLDSPAPKTSDDWDKAYKMVEVLIPSPAARHYKTVRKLEQEAIRDAAIRAEFGSASDDEESDDDDSAKELKEHYTEKAKDEDSGDEEYVLDVAEAEITEEEKRYQDMRYKARFPFAFLAQEFDDNEVDSEYSASSSSESESGSEFGSDIVGNGGTVGVGDSSDPMDVDGGEWDDVEDSSDHGDLDTLSNPDLPDLPDLRSGKPRYRN
ncbi:hypothetical protein ONS95_000397 [Cadophora gregata]|uniref:uncharacterized protein n=1 Tax=Cadophora gregata TaxID=51156 RepID=UPI0026DB26CB|nr:uncharacterized protein ONS95_000397 [Cadophora gregata]KAK0128424.1 hypothetical protein ONS95_000397 [Cadophora gregata]